MSEQLQRERKALDVLALMRGDGMSLTAASRLVEITPEAVREEVGHVLFKEGRRWRVKPWDRIPRPVRFLTRRGVIEVVARDSRTASRIARYWNAVHQFARTGDESLLDPFRNRTFQSFGETFEFLTDEDAIERLALVGQVSFEDLYSQAA